MFVDPSVLGYLFDYGPRTGFVGCSSGDTQAGGSVPTEAGKETLKRNTSLPDRSSVA